MNKPPRHLYKYMRRRLDRIGDVLVNRRLHFANPACFNDPFDCALGLDLRHGATTQDWVDYFIHLLEEETPESTNEARRARAEDNVRRGRHTDSTFLDEVERGICQNTKKFGRELGVLCLSTDPKNVIMWAHYADNHEGLVLCFDSRHMVDQTSEELRCFEVKYDFSFPQLSEYLVALRESKSGNFRAFTRLSFCRKSQDWEYEKEWRFFAGKPDSFVRFDAPALSSIIFGWKMPESIRQLVAAWAMTLNPQPKLLLAEPCPDRFRMDIKRMKMGVQPGV